VDLFERAWRAPDLAERPVPALTLLPAGPFGEEIAARLALRLGGTALGRCGDISLAPESIVATRAACGGRLVATLRAPAVGNFAAMRAPKAVSAGGRDGQGRIHRITLDGALPELLPVARTPTGERKRPLEGAKVVVSGGRGMAGPEGFALLEALAAALGGALGGSLPTVDAGWIPVARQVGQSGKFVTPDLYFAVGISGTPQHLAGIGSDTRIVAINKDSEADIFRVAEVGVVADWKELLPALLAALQKENA
jgi:electron transfer flavoprotein alpha subunit